MNRTTYQNKTQRKSKMAKPLKDILAGVKKSTVVPGSTGDEPGVDYMPKAKDEQEFVKKHKTEKHEDRVGNGDDVYNASNVKHSQIDDKKHGYKNPEDKGVNESTIADIKKKMSKHEELAVAANRAGDDEKTKHHQMKVQALKQKLSKMSESLAVPLIGSADGDGDESAEMAKAELKAIADKAMHLVMSIPDSMMVEPWVQSKIAKAKEMVARVHDYMVYGDHSEQTAPIDGGVDMTSGTVRNTYPNF